MEGDILEKRKEKIKYKILTWIKDPRNLMLIGILILAFAVRLYFFFLTKTQPLWWDEACYGTLAKNLVYHAWDNTSVIIGETHIRPLFFPVLWSILIRIGISEVGNRFLLEFIPSFLSIFFVYLIGKELYGKRIGLISSFIFSVLWIHLFYTARFLTNVPALLFLFSSIYFFIRSTKKDFNFKFFSISLILLSIATLIRYPNGFVFFVYLIFLFFTKKIFLIKKLKFWYSTIIGLIPLLLFFLINFIKYRNIFPALLGGGYVNPLQVGGEVAPFAFNILNNIPGYLKTVFFIFFLFGIGVALFEIVIGYNVIFKNQKLKSHIFLILLMLVFFSFFIFYLRVAEDRYLFPTGIALVCFSAIGINYLYKFVKKYNKYLALFLVLIILFLGAYSQIKFADNLIKMKKESFLQIRQGFEWLKENSPEDSIILGTGIEPYSVYYAERSYESFPENKSDVDKIDADYLIVHSFAPPPSYINDYLQENQDKWQPINAFFFDEEQKQVALVIYIKTNKNF